tara:strand:+ start:445 stop:606 length:162 start_codon:yes stop_codon:yes gene_type:complete
MRVDKKYGEAANPAVTPIGRYRFDVRNVAGIVICQSLNALGNFVPADIGRPGR